MDVLDSFQEPILTPEVVEILESNKPGFDYLTWVIYPILVLIALVVIILVVVFIVRKIKNNSLSPEFKNLVKECEAFLNRKDFSSAKKIYIRMRDMCNRNETDKKMRNVTLDFYNKIIAGEKNV